MSVTDTQRFPEPVVLLAAGLGTRMAPITHKRPKPLIEVAGAPLIDRVVENFWSEGATNFAVNAHHHLSQIETHVTVLPTKFPGTVFCLSPEPDELLNTGGGAKQALERVKGDPVFVANTDAFWQSGADRPLARMRALFQSLGGVVLLCAHPARATGFRRSHDFCLAPDASITNDRGVPVIYAGIALLERSIFEGTPDTPFSFADLLFAAQDANRLTGVLLDAPWLHVGDPQAIAEAEGQLAR